MTRGLGRERVQQQNLSLPFAIEIEAPVPAHSKCSSITGEDAKCSLL